MQDLQIHDEKRAQKILKSSGDEAIRGFKSTLPEAIVVRSKFDSIACWDHRGSFHYVVVSSFSGPGSPHSGPNEQGVEAPLLFKIRVNLQPPAEIFKIMERDAVPESELANAPILEIHGRAREISSLGAWLPTWYESHRRKVPFLPKAPAKLLYNPQKHGPEQPSLFRDITSLEDDWRNERSLWTEWAAKDFFGWFQGF